MKTSLKVTSVLFILVLLGALSTVAQTAAFTYQGKLTDASVPANGQYDLVFRLFDGAGTQIGGDQIKDNVQVSAGIFTVSLDFGASPFTSGTGDSLEIGARPGASTGAFTTLSPRQALTSSPYAIKSVTTSTADSLSPACVLCVVDGHIQSVGGSKITGIVGITNGGTGAATPAVALANLGGASTSDDLSQFAPTTSARLASVISDETGTGPFVLRTSPTLISPVISSITNTGTLTLPTLTDTLVGRNTTDTLTNKSLTNPAISNPSISGTANFAGLTNSNSGIRIGTAGTTISSSTVFSVSVPAIAISANSCSDISAGGVSGSVAGSPVAVGVPTTPDIGLAWSAYVTGSTTAVLRLCNLTGAAITPTAQTWQLRIFNP